MARVNCIPLVAGQSQAYRDLGIEPRRIGFQATDLMGKLREMQPVRLRKRARDARRVLAAIGGRMSAFPTVLYRLLEIRVRDLEPVLDRQLDT